MEKKWIGFIAIFAVIWIIYIGVSLYLVYLSSMSVDFMFNEMWVTYFTGFFLAATFFSGERLRTKDSHRSYIFFLLTLIVISVIYYILSLYVIIPWAEEVGWL